MPEPLSAKTLGIEPWERDALVHVAAQLRTDGATLDMAHAATCFGGLMLAFGQARGDIEPTISAPSYLMSGRSASPALRPLFHPGNGGPNSFNHPGWKADARAGARAIDAFLAGARARCWNIALQEIADA